MFEKTVAGFVLGMMLLFATTVVLKTIFVILSSFVEGSPTWGDILGTIPIVVAICIATIGWLINAKNKKKEIERGAIAEGRIFYYSYKQAGQFSERYLYIVFYMGGMLFPMLNEEDVDYQHPMLKSCYQSVKGLAESMEQTLPETRELQERLSVIYQHGDKFGDIFSQASSSVETLRRHLDYFNQSTIKKMLADTEQSPEFEFSRLDALLGSLLSVLRDFEKIRELIGDASYKPKIGDVNRKVLQTNLNKVIDLDEESSTMDSNSYIDILAAASNYYQKKSERFERILRGG